MRTTLEIPISTALQTCSPSAPVWVKAGTLLDGSSAKPIANAHLVYDAERIRYVGAADSPPPAHMLRPGQTTPDLELPEHTVMPGLIEAHAHIFLDGAPVDFDVRKQYLQQNGTWLLERGRKRQSQILKTGVMAMRDAGDNHGVGLILRDEFLADPAGGLYIDSPGAAIHHKGRYGSFMGLPIEDHADAEECVASRCAEGADRIKLLTTGIINFKKGAVTAPPQMTVDEVAALVSAAQKHGKQTFAHASGSEGIENAIEGGITSVEHGFFVMPEQLAKMRDRGTAWVPTFAPVQIQIDRAAEMGWSEAIVDKLKAIIAGHNQSLARAAQIGVTVIAGSDAGSCGVPHGLGFLTELELMEKAGMSSQATLNAATGVSADTLAFKKPFGHLRADMLPRMIITRHSPLETVRNLRREKILVIDGQVIESDGTESEEGL